RRAHWRGPRWKTPRSRWIRARGSGRGAPRDAQDVVQCDVVRADLQEDVAVLDGDAADDARLLDAVGTLVVDRPAEQVPPLRQLLQLEQLVETGTQLLEALERRELCELGGQGVWVHRRGRVLVAELGDEQLQELLGANPLNAGRCHDGRLLLLV